MNTYIKASDLNTWVAKYFKNKDLISVDDLIACIEELDGTIENLEEEKQNIIDERDEYYKPRYRDKYEEYGISEKDFY